MTSMACANAGSDSTGRVEPCLRAFCDEFALPSGVRGPGLFCALCRLAAILNALFTGAPGLVERNDLEFRLLGLPDRVPQALREFDAPTVEFA